MSECVFCADYQMYKKINKELNKKDKRISDEPFKHEYTVALVIRDWFPSAGKKNASRSIHYRNKGLGYKLNFCPECGKEI